MLNALIKPYKSLKPGENGKIDSRHFSKRSKGQMFCVVALRKLSSRPGTGWSSHPTVSLVL